MSRNDPHWGKLKKTYSLNCEACGVWWMPSPDELTYSNTVEQLRYEGWKLKKAGWTCPHCIKQQEGVTK